MDIAALAIVWLTQARSALPTSSVVVLTRRGRGRMATVGAALARAAYDVTQTLHCNRVIVMDGMLASGINGKTVGWPAELAATAGLLP